MFKQNRRIERIMACVLIFIMSFATILTVSAESMMETDISEGTWVAEDFEYEGTTVIGFSESGIEKFENNKNLIIPQTNIEGDPITAIGTGAFWSDVHTKDEDKIESLELPNTIERIEKRAFGGNLIKRLELPASVESIDDGAFLSNQIEHLTINEGLKYIGRLTFANNQLTELTIPSSLENIGQRAFFNNKISGLTILPGIEKLGAQCFENNVIEEVDIPETVKYIDLGAFVYNNISSVIFPEGLKIVGPKAFGVNNLESVVFPETVESFCPNSFRKNLGFENGEFKIYIDKIVEIEDTLTEEEIEDRLKEEIKVRAAVFEDLIDDQKHIIDIKSWEKVGEEDGILIYKGKFDAVPEDKIVCGSGTSCENTVENMERTSLIVKVKMVEESVEPGWSSEYFTFEGTTVTGFSESGQKKFEEDKDVIIPAKTLDGQIVDSIGTNAFRNKGLTSVQIPDTVKHIGMNAFAMNNLTSIELPEGLTEMGNMPFAQNKLTSVKIPSGLEVISTGAFFNNNLTSVQIPEGVTTIAVNAFGQNNLETVLFPSTMEYIMANSFKDNNLGAVTIPSNVTHFSDNAFDENANINLTFSILVEALEEAEQVETEGMTEENIAALQEAINAGKEINDKPMATLEEVNEAVEEIQEAIKGLVDKPEEKPSKPITINSINKTEVDDKLEITISVYAQEDISGLVILTPINQSGRTYNVIYESKDFVNGNNEVKIELNFSDYLNGINEIKTYIWDNLENMKPLSTPSTGLLTY